jgi:hypothetical protein
MKYILTKRKEVNNKNTAFIYTKENETVTYSATTPTIISWIKTNVKTFETKDVDGSYTKVKVVEDFLKSPSNNGTTDNIDSLPKY